MNINLGGLPKDVLKHGILPFLDTADLESVSLMNRRLHEVASSNSVWEAFAKKINCPINRESDATVCKQVKDFVISIKKDINKLPEEFSFWQFWRFSSIRDIQRIISNRHIPTIKQIETLQEYRKARDIIVVWKAVANKIEVKVPELDSPDFIKNSKKFSDWCNKYQNKLDQIQELFLLGYQLSSLSPEIGKLTNLEKLQLQNNYLTSLPPEIGKLVQLSWLILADNCFSSLPEAIGKLTNLRNLGLQGNQLISLPEIGNLKLLEELNLKNNPLTSVTFGDYDNLIQLKRDCVTKVYLDSYSPLFFLDRFTLR